MKHFKAIKIDNEIQYFGDWDKFKDSLKDGQMFEIAVISDKEFRSTMHNRYLWGYTYRPFTPHVFQTVNDAHEYFTGLFLSHTEVIDFTKENFITLINDIQGKARKINDYIKKGDKVEFTWIQSSTSLNPKEMAEYIKNIQLIGNEKGINFEEFDKNRYYS